VLQFLRWKKGVESLESLGFLGTLGTLGKLETLEKNLLKAALKKAPHALEKQNRLFQEAEQALLRCKRACFAFALRAFIFVSS